ncbi:hypothetical protein ACFV3E_24700 [Streptomyces sp. NPDC059718]
MEDIARWVVQRHQEDPGAEFFGLEVAKATGYGPGTTYPIVRRMCEAGWLVAREEGEEPRKIARPPRVYYRIDPESLPAVRQRLAEIDARRRKMSGLSGALGTASGSAPIQPDQGRP